MRRTGSDILRGRVKGSPAALPYTGGGYCASKNWVCDDDAVPAKLLAQNLGSCEI